MKIHNDIEQGSDEWHALRCGILTASEVKLLITPKTGKIAKNDKVKAHIYELTAQRLSQYVEPSYVSDDMLRGHEGEIEARAIYSDLIAPVTEVGFITEDKWGFTLGYSPDGLVGDDGLIEIKSPRQKAHIKYLIEQDPSEHMMQMQVGMLVTGRKWCDFISYHGGLHMKPQRIHADEDMHALIIEAGIGVEDAINANVARYNEVIADAIPTERAIEEEIII